MEVKSTFMIDASITDVWRVLTTSSTAALSPIGAVLADHEGYRFAATVTLEISPVEVHFRGRGSDQPRRTERHELVARLSGSLGVMTPHRTVVTIATRLKVADGPLPLVETIARHAAERLIEELQACMTHGLGPEPSIGAPGSGPITGTGSRHIGVRRAGPALALALASVAALLVRRIRRAPNR